MTKMLYWGAALAAVSTVGYAVYFDHKRRTDPLFRRQLKQQRRQAEEMLKKEEKPIAMEEEPVPTTPEQVQRYFMKYLQMGEQLLQQGPEQYENAAGCFYRALKVYPDPMQLMMALEQSLPQQVMEILMAMMAQDVETAKID